MPHIGSDQLLGQDERLDGHASRMLYAAKRCCNEFCEFSQSSQNCSSSSRTAAVCEAMLTSQSRSKLAAGPDLCWFGMREVSTAPSTKPAC